MAHYTARSDEGIRVPYSGWLVARLLDFTRVRASFQIERIPASNRTLERYLAGDFVSQTEVAPLVWRRFAEEMLPDLDLKPQMLRGTSGTMRDLVFLVLEGASLSWDRLASEVNHVTSPAFAPRDLLVALGRFFVLDVALRLAAWLAACVLEGMPGEIEQSLIRGDAFYELLEACRGNQTWEEVAKVLGVSLQTVHAWRSGKYLPSHESIQTVAMLFGPENETENLLLEARLRRAVAFDGFVATLRNEMSDELADDYLAGGLKIANALRDIIVERQLQSGCSADAHVVIADMIANGSGSSAGRDLLALFLPKVENQVLRRDLRYVLAGRTAEAVTCWTRMLADSTRRISEGELDLADELRGIRRIMTLHEYEVEIEPTRSEHPEDPKGPSDLALVVRHVDPALAEALLRRAIAMIPDEPVHHFRLGAHIGRNTGGESARVEAALVELHIATQLAPVEGVFRNQIGITLANARRHDEARRAFERAEQTYGYDSYHWYCRGANSIALGDFATAIDELEQCLKCSGAEEDQVKAMVLLACACGKVGDSRSAKKWSRRVQHYRRFDPLDDPDTILDGLFTAPPH